MYELENGIYRKKGNGGGGAPSYQDLSAYDLAEDSYGGFSFSEEGNTRARYSAGNFVTGGIIYNDETYNVGCIARYLHYLPNSGWDKPILHIKAPPTGYNGGIRGWYLQISTSVTGWTRIEAYNANSRRERWNLPTPYADPNVPHIIRMESNADSTLLKVWGPNGALEEQYIGQASAAALGSTYKNWSIYGNGTVYGSENYIDQVEFMKEGDARYDELKTF